jgi:hypothetical protein
LTLLRYEANLGILDKDFEVYLFDGRLDIGLIENPCCDIKSNLCATQFAEFEAHNLVVIFGEQFELPTHIQEKSAQKGDSSNDYQCFCCLCH